jgi:kynurenine formamidase
VRVRKVVDLSLPIDAATQGYPGDPAVRMDAAATIAVQGFNLLSVRMGSQTATHCDAPYHFLGGGAPIDEVDLRLCTGTGVLVDLRGRSDRATIDVADVARDLGRFAAGSIAVLYTGWAAHYGTGRYFDHPYLTPAACAALLAAGVRTFCLDAPSVDETPTAARAGDGFPVHRLIAGAGGVIVENLCHLEQIDFAEPLIAVFPLKLTGADGAPTRAVALDIEPTTPPGAPSYGPNSAP